MVTSDPELAAWLRKARDHGRASKYEHEFEGRNSRMDGLQGAVLSTQGYAICPAGTSGGARSPPPPCRSGARGGGWCHTGQARADYGVSACHLYVVRVPKRDQVLAALRDAGIEAGAHYPVPLHLQRAYARLEIPGGALPVTETASREVLSLPLYPELDPTDIGRVVRALRAAPLGSA